jgi:hypothetical protein
VQASGSPLRTMPLGVEQAMLGIVFVFVVGAASRSFTQVISPAAPNVNETEDAPPPVAGRGGRGLGGAVVTSYQLPWAARPRAIEGRTTTPLPYT